jgi:MFS family permease
MVLAGGLMAGVGTILLSRADSYWELIILFSGIVSLGKSAGFGQTLMAAVNQWFIRRRSVAMSTLMTAFAGGGAFVVLLLNLGIQQVGWRDTLLWTGVFIVVMTVPAAFFIRSRPEDIGLLPDGDPPVETGSGSGSSGRGQRGGDDSFSFRQAISTRTYWLIMVGAILRVSVTNGMLVHIFPIMAVRGISENEAAAWVAAMFFLGIPLRFIMGVTSGKFRGNVLLAIGMVLGAVGMGGLWIGPGLSGLLLFVVGIAIVEGITSVNWLMLSDYYGRARFATLMGFMSLFMNVGMFVSPYVSGLVFDRTGSYYYVLAVFTPLYLVSAVAFLFATRPDKPASTRRRWIGTDAHMPAAPSPSGAGN